MGLSKSAIYMRKYRKTNKEEIKAYDNSNERYKKTLSRNKVRKQLISKGINLNGKSIHHRNGNALDNRKKNLSIVKAYHGHKKTDKKYKR